MRPTCLRFVFVSIALFGAAEARAQPAEPERLFREGRRLMLEGRFDEACPMIAESQRLDPHTGTLLNLAACHEKQGKVATAWVEYQKALTAARAEGQADRVRLAQERVDALEPHVPWLAVDAPVDAPTDLEVKLDGAAIQRAAWGKEMPVDPGPHVVAASAPSRAPFEERLELRESEHRTVHVASVGPLPPEPPKTTLVVEPPKEAAPTPENPPARRRWVFDAGFFVGFLSAKADSSSTRAANPGAISYRDANGTTQSCASGAGCTYAIGGSNSAAGTAGVDLFFGYSFSEQFEAGVRAMAGPRLSHADTGGAFLAGGPAVWFHAGGPVRIGASLLLGGVSFTDYGTTAAPYGGGSVSGGPYLLNATAGGFGLGLDVAWDFLKLPGGALAAKVSPLFLFGDGSAWALPVGVVYRFR
jgi:hypothetical protein